MALTLFRSLSQAPRRFLYHAHTINNKNIFNYLYHSSRDNSYKLNAFSQSRNSTTNKAQNEQSETRGNEVDTITANVIKRPPFSHPFATRYKSFDERTTFHLALQDMSQSKSEGVPPEGSLTVSLLRHQRIVLAWMIQKEHDPHCSGGILADDQGMGKTLSIISLILTLQSPPHSPSTLAVINRTTRRLTAGTLIVVPTIVIRQWADELESKVSKEAKLTFYVYHGSGRTRDVDELASYDVVVTTYAIVTMEAPKQPLEDEDEKSKKESNVGPLGKVN